MSHNMMSNIVLPPTSGEQKQVGKIPFMEKLGEIMVHAGVALNLSLGHRLGLFDLLASMKPSTSDQIAKQGKFQERYVREWLNAMTTGGIIQYDPNNKTYSLPSEHAALLKKENNNNNPIIITQFFPMFGQIEEDIIKCFQQGSGIPYSKFKRFHEVMAEQSATSSLPLLIDHVVPMVGGLKEKLHAGIDVADFGCGRGQALLLLAETFPKSRFVGYDLCDDALEWGRQQVNSKRLSNIQFITKDLCHQMDERNKFDFILTLDAVHDQASPALLLRSIHNALRPNGIYIMQDIHGSSCVEKNLNYPPASLLYTISLFHCMTVSLAQQDGVGVGTMWGEEMMHKLLQEAGFSNIQLKQFPTDPLNVYVSSIKTA